MQDELRNLQMGSGSFVCSEASTRMWYLCSARHSPLGGIKFSFYEKWNSKVDSQITPRVALQDITDDEVMKLLERIVPQHAQKYIDWDQTKKEQGTWPRKMKVSMWFKHETNLLTMIDLLKIMKKELDKAAYKINGQNVKARLD